jgi:hypothetical protein
LVCGPTGWREALRGVLSDGGLPRKLAARGGDRVRGEFCWQSTAKRVWLDWFERV